MNKKKIGEKTDSLLEENKPWYKYGKAVGIAVLAAIGILAGSMASQADSAKFVSSVQHIINSEDVMP